MSISIQSWLWYRGIMLCFWASGRIQYWTTGVYEAFIEAEEVWLAHVELIFTLKEHDVVDCTINGA